MLEYIENALFLRIPFPWWPLSRFQGKGWGVLPMCVNCGRKGCFYVLICQTFNLKYVSCYFCTFCLVFIKCGQLSIYFMTSSNFQQPIDWKYFVYKQNASVLNMCLSFFYKQCGISLYSTYAIRHVKMSEACLRTCVGFVQILHHFMEGTWTSTEFGNSDGS